MLDEDRALNQPSLSVIVPVYDDAVNLHFTAHALPEATWQVTMTK